MATNTTHRAALALAVAAVSGVALAASAVKSSTPEPASAATPPETPAAPGTCAGGSAVATPLPSARAHTGAAQPAAYNWPLKPFGRQHPVRAYFNDPRIGAREHVFHFGIDIAASDGTAVYAVAPGRAWVTGENVAVVGERTFGYWHIRPAVAMGEAVRLHQLVGYIARGWGHVHFAESTHRQYLNPLRPGALGPYVDRTAPTVGAAGADRGMPHVLSGRVNLVAQAYDTTPIGVPGRWHDEPVTPALVRWRLVASHRRAPAWRTAADFRGEMLPADAFPRIYAPATKQNHIGEPGLFCFNLQRRLNTTKLADGGYELQVELRDTRNNRSVTRTHLTIANGS